MSSVHNGYGLDGGQRRCYDAPPVAKLISLTFLAVASPIILLSFLVEAPAGEVIFALLAVAFPFALIALGAVRYGRLGRVGGALATLLLIFEICFVAMLMLRGRDLAGPWLGGLPLGTAIQFYGVFLLPLPFVALLYALSFERFLPPEDLAELRRRFGRSDAEE